MTNERVFPSGRCVDVSSILNDLHYILSRMHKRPHEVVERWCDTKVAEPMDAVTFVVHFLMPQRMSKNISVKSDWQKAAAEILSKSSLSQLFDIPDDFSSIRYRDDVPESFVEELDEFGFNMYPGAIELQIGVGKTH